LASATHLEIIYDLAFVGHTRQRFVNANYFCDTRAICCLSWDGRWLWRRKRNDEEEKGNDEEEQVSRYSAEAIAFSTQRLVPPTLFGGHALELPPSDTQSPTPVA
jgi:hypothetical protein